MQTISINDVMREVDRIRIQKRINQEELCEYIQVSRQAYGKYMSGKNAPGGDILIRMIQYLKIDLSKIIFKEKEYESQVKERNVEYVKCKNCEEKEYQIKELFKTIENLNDCLDSLRSKKKSGPDETAKLAKKH